jgi:parallel beta-helix repeat protein
LHTVHRSLFVRGVVATAGSGALVMGMMIAAPSLASAATVSCGTVLTASLTLTQNLDCTSDTTSTALTIGAVGVTVDLNGHEILGPGDLNNTVGIVDDGYNNVTVENGSMSNFSDDVEIEGVSGTPLTGAVVKSLKTTDNTVDYSDSVFGDYLSGASVQALSSNDADYGVYLDNSESSTISSSSLVSPFIGLYDDFGAGNTWSHNSIANVAYEGIYLDLTSADVVKDNTVTGTGAYGIEDEESSGTTITKNTLNDVYDAIYQFRTDGTVSSNKGSHDSYGVYADETTNETYTNNQFNYGQFGIETDYPTGELLKGNTTNHNSDLGVYIYTNNETTGGYSATLDNNTANSNRFGLYSQIVTSGSGNHATGNKVLNCYNVSC